jgi:hypothetical protein
MLATISALCLVAVVGTIAYKNHGPSHTIRQDLAPRPCTTADMTWLVQNYYQYPLEVLGLKAAGPLSTAELKAQMLMKCNELLIHASRPGVQSEQTLQKDLQILISAYFIMIMQRLCSGHASCSSQAGPGPQVQLNVCNVQVEQTHIMNQHNVIIAKLEERAQQAEVACTSLHRELAKAESNARQLSAQIACLENERNSVQLLAKCAPAWFSAFVSFLDKECKQGPDLRVGSAQLPDTFCRFLHAHATTIQPPTQRELTAQLVRLGFNYAQVHIHGGNARGFRGFSIRQPLALQSS